MSFRFAINESAGSKREAMIPWAVVEEVSLGECGCRGRNRETGVL